MSGEPDGRAVLRREGDWLVLSVGGARVLTVWLGDVLLAEGLDLEPVLRRARDLLDDDLLPLWV